MDRSMDEKFSNQVILIFALIGLVTGIMIDTLWRFEVKQPVYYTFFSLFPLLYALSFNNKDSLRLVLTSLIMALILAFPIWGINLDHPLSQGMRLVSFCAGYPALVYIGHCFHYAGHHENRYRVSYRSLYAGVWNTIPLLFIAFVFSGLANLLIFTAAMIFKSVGNFWLWDLYYHNSHFRFVSHTTLFFIGLGIGQQNIRIIYNLRFLLLKMMYYLFPFLAGITVLYFLMYWGQFLAGFDPTKELLEVLIALVTLGIIFFNGYFQDGSQKSSYPVGLQLFLRLYRIVLLILAIMLFVKIIQWEAYGLNTLLYFILPVLYGAVYAVTAFYRQPRENEAIGRGNIAIALFYFIVFYLLNNPIAPITYQFGAHSQTSQVIVPRAMTS